MHSAVKDYKSSRIAALELDMARLKTAAEVKRQTKTNLDSAANIRIIAYLHHVNSHTSPSFCRAVEPHGVETASRESLAVEGRDQILGVNVAICSGAGASFFSMAQICDERNASCLVTSSGACVFANSKGSDVLVNNVNDLITSTQTCNLSTPRNTDSMHEITSTHVPTVDDRTHTHPCVIFIWSCVGVCWSTGGAFRGTLGNSSCSVL